MSKWKKTEKDYEETFYAAHNDELEGMRFAIENSVPINVNNGMLLNTAIETAINTKRIELVKWLLDNGANADLLTLETMYLIKKYGTKELKELITKR